jgi:thiol-disulfide isomerase/thioredoxin
MYLTITRMVLAAIFLVAAISKLWSGLAKSRKTLTDFGVPPWLVASMSIVLPFAELCIACLLLPASSARFGAISALALLLAFNFAIAANLALGRTPNCNCFGQLHSTPIGRSTLVRNSVLAALAGWVVWQGQRQASGSLLQVTQSISGRDIVVTSVAFLAFAAIGAGALVMLQLFRQNGRLLLRMDALEARLAVSNLGAAAALVPSAPIPPSGLPIGSIAPEFELLSLKGGKKSLQRLLSEGKALLLIFSSPNCGPCNALMPDIAGWQSSLAAEVKIVLISDGGRDLNQAKAAGHRLIDVFVEKKRKVAEKFHAFGTPTAVVIRQNGTVGSYLVGGADAIRQLVVHKGWSEAGFASYLKASAQPQAPPPRPTLPVGSAAPAFTLPDLNERTIDLSVLGGQPTVLLFWNVACGFCQRMLPQLIEWEEKRAPSSPRLVLISSSSREANAQMGLKSTILLDQTFGVGTLYGASGTPSALLVDASGRIASGLSLGAPSVLDLLGRPKELPEAGPVALASVN